MIKIDGITVINCGTGIKATGHVDMDISGYKGIGNGRDIDLEVTNDSNVYLRNLAFQDTKIEGLSIKEYRTIEQRIIEIKDLTEMEKDKIIDFAKAIMVEKKSKDIIQDMYEKIKETLISSPAQIALALVIKSIVG